ncbi:MAG: hypothetical protein IH621_14820, partial [Krumholzibacteria bacterium]|nr:hypothetical protein [Candidatus Krumholzibacteria bacterium]
PARPHLPEANPWADGGWAEDRSAPPAGAGPAQADETDQAVAALHEDGARPRPVSAVW